MTDYSFLHLQASVTDLAQAVRALAQAHDRLVAVTERIANTYAANADHRAPREFTEADFNRIIHFGGPDLRRFFTNGEVAPAQTPTRAPSPHRTHQPAQPQARAPRRNRR